MYFELLLICCAGYLMQNMCDRRMLSKEEGQREKQDILLWAGILLLLLIFYQKTASVAQLLCGYLLMGGIFVIWSLRRAVRGIAPAAGFLLKAVLIPVIYSVAVSVYEPSADDGMSGEIVHLWFWIISLLLVFSEKIKAGLQGLDQYMRYEALFRILMVSVPVWCFVIVEQSCNEILDEMDWLFLSGNLVFLLLWYVCLYVIVPCKKWMAGVFLTTGLVFGLANYYVSQFRGSPAMPSDLLSLHTAFQVAGGYAFEITAPVMTGVLYWYAAITLLCCLPDTEKTPGWKGRPAAGSLIVVLCIWCLGHLDIEEQYQMQTVDQWQVNNLYNKKGSVLSFAGLAKKMKVEKPDGYSTRLAEEKLRHAESEQKKAQDPVTPSVIVVMDESFSDLRSLGDFACTQEYLKEWYATDDFACRGSLYVSIYGGFTANTEFEFLTGCSLANCVPGVVPYQIYDLKNVGNLAGMLTDTGYTATAIHPQYKGNWNRMRTYAKFGFDDFLGMEDFEDPRYVRSHISDESSFDKVKEVYEKNRNKQFLFNVTMQNHGGYNPQDLSDEKIIRLKKKPEQYTDVEAYLTLMRESDQAVKELLDYFREVPDPVIVCIFGDHHPGVDKEWIEEVMGKPAADLSLEEAEKKYAVPYMIWANFDTPYEQCEMDTSANYLGALLLENAGLPQSAFTGFLQQMRKEIPVINASGYQTKDGVWHKLDEKDRQGWLEAYAMVQYYAMFDNGRVQDYFLP